MDIQYRALSSQKASQSKFQKFVEDANVEELCKMVLNALNTHEVDKMLGDIFLGFSLSNKTDDKRFKLVKAIFDHLKNAQLTGKYVENIVSRIVAEFSLFNKIHLAKLVDYFIERIRNNDDSFMSWKDVLPLLLERLEEEKTVNYRGQGVSGQDYKNSVIGSICDIDWDTKILTSLAKMFVEFNLDLKNKSVSMTVMTSLTSKMMEINLNELPPLVHQMLKLGSDYNSLLFFSTLTKYFIQSYDSVNEEVNSEDMSDSIISSNISLKELQEVESTVFYHIYQSALDNTKGSNEYIRCLKSVVNAPEYVLSPFVMSVLLLLTSIYEDSALQILKLALLRQIQDNENQNNSWWLNKILSNNASVMDTLNRVIESSCKDRQLVIKGMVDLAFILLAVERKAGAENHLPWDCGHKILQKLARKRHDVGGVILETLVDKIIRGGQNVVQYTDCLGYLCRRLTMMVLEHKTCITGLLDHLLAIPGSAAAQVLRAMLPLMRVSGDIRDQLIMILRKALHRKGTHVRQMAVLGFLQLLKNLKLSSLAALSQSESLSSSNIASSSSLFSQVSVERPSQRNSDPWHNTHLCREILAVLSKCFSHEVQVRSYLYQELYYSIAKNEELVEFVIEMLMEHLFEYYEKDEQVLPPFMFDKCGTIQGAEVVLQEPLADLVFTLQKIYVKVASKDSSTIDKLAVILESLCKRMSSTDVEHFGLDEETDILDNTPKSQQKLLNVKAAISMYEALIAYRIASWSPDSVNIGQSVIALYKGYLRFAEYVKKLGKKKGGKGKKDKEKDKDGNDTTMKKGGGRPTTVKLPNTVMDFDTINKSVILLYNRTNSWATEEQTSGLRGRIEFHIYILLVCLQLFQNVKTLKDYELKNCLELNKQNFFSIGQTLFKYVVSDLQSTTSFNEQVGGLGLECFKECCDVMCTVYPSELPAFLQKICGVETSKGLSVQIQGLISPLKDVFLANFNEEQTEELISQKIPVHLLETISKLVLRITFNDIKPEKVFDWLYSVAENQEDLNPQVAGLIIQLILLIEERSSEHGETIQDLSIEFSTVLGKIDKGEVTSTRKFQMLNESNIYLAYIAINKILSSKLQNANWLLGRLNAEHIAATSLGYDSESNRKRIKEIEQSLCRQFSFVIGVFEVLAGVKISPGQASDVIFKNLQKVYNFACSLAKYFRKKSTPTNPAFQSVKFIPVIQGAGNALKQAITELILHIEVSQSGGKSTDANVQRNKILKEVMVIPGVVQAFNMFDNEIALLAKKTNVDLMKYTKFDVIRDFRIKNTQLMENLEKMDVSLLVTQANRNVNQNDEANENNDSESEDEVTPSKRSRTD